MSEYPEILGIYSQKKLMDMGDGMTTGKHDSVTHWYVRQLAEDRFEVRPLNPQNVPSGIAISYSAMEFLCQFSPEPDYYAKHTVPALQTLAKKIQMGERALAKGDLDESERQFIKALMIDETNVDANLGLGEVYAQQEDVAKLRKVLDLLMGMDQVFQQENRVKFNRFGINLRRNGYFDDAIHYYEKALTIIDTDENVYFNMARCHFEKGDLDACKANLLKALELAPEFVEAKKFLAYCSKAKDETAESDAKSE